MVAHYIMEYLYILTWLQNGSTTENLKRNGQCNKNVTRILATKGTILLNTDGVCI